MVKVVDRPLALANMIFQYSSSEAIHHVQLHAGQFINLIIISWPFKISEAEATVVGKTTVPATTSRAPSAARRTRFRFRPLPDAMSTARIAGAKQTPGPRWAAADAAAAVASRDK